MWCRRPRTTCGTSASPPTPCAHLSPSHPQRKKRTHLREGEEASKKGEPKSFVFRRGRHAALLKDLEKDLRRLMLPNTAAALKESRCAADHHCLRMDSACSCCFLPELALRRQTEALARRQMPAQNHCLCSCSSS